MKWTLVLMPIEISFFVNEMQLNFIFYLMDLVIYKILFKLTIFLFTSTKCFISCFDSEYSTLYFIKIIIEFLVHYRFPLKSIRNFV